MKKIFSIFLAIALVIGVTSAVQAAPVYSRSGNATIETEVLGGTVTATLSSNIIAGHKVIGFTYSDSAAGVGTLADLAAAGSLTATSAYIFGEVKVAAGSTASPIFPLPRKITNGLVMKNSTTTGVLIVYYEK